MIWVDLSLLLAEWPVKYHRRLGAVTGNTAATNIVNWDKHTKICANTDTEMKYIVAALYSNYSTTVVDDTGIEQSDSYTAPPKGNKLVIRLEKLEV